MQWVEMNGRKYNLVGGTISHAVVNPTWDPVAMPGALNAFFKGNPEGKNPMDMRAGSAGLVDPIGLREAV